MKSYINRLGCAIVIIATLASQARADNYMIDASHTSIIFGVSHLGYSFTYGRFNKLNGSFNLNPSNPASSSFQLNIDASSIDTNDAKRDQHLKGPDFFNTSQFPVISFQSTAVTTSVDKEDGKTVYNVTGNLTMHGQTKPVTLPLKMLGEGKGPYGNHRAGFYCNTKLKRTAFGMTNMVPSIGDDVAITISFEGIRKTAAEESSTTRSAGSASSSSGSSSRSNRGSGSR